MQSTREASLLHFYSPFPTVFISVENDIIHGLPVVQFIPLLMIRILLEFLMAKVPAIMLLEIIRLKKKESSLDKKSHASRNLHVTGRRLSKAPLGVSLISPKTIIKFVICNFYTIISTV